MAFGTRGESGLAVLVLAAGRGARFGAGAGAGASNKVHAPLGRETVLRQALVSLSESGLVRAAVSRRVAGAAGELELCRAAGAGLDWGAPFAGGATRADSVRNGLAALDSACGARRILVHDGARPFPSAACISALSAALDAGADGAFASTPVEQALHRVRASEGATDSTPDSTPNSTAASPIDSPPDSTAASPIDSPPDSPAGAEVISSLSRDGLRLAQTPQMFDLEVLRSAHAARLEVGARSLPLEDDAGLVAALGGKVAAVAGSRDNLKITQAQDLACAEAILATRTSERARETTATEESLAARFAGDAAASALLRLRIGVGRDVHRFGAPAAGSSIRLGGVSIPSPRPLLAHSDGDAALHALVDALLSPLGAGDLGTLFPSSDSAFADADSAHFVRKACALLAARGGFVLQVELTLTATMPHLAPHRDAICASVASLLGLPRSRVGCKATTTDGLGALGRGEGLGAEASVLLVLPA